MKIDDIPYIPIVIEKYNIAMQTLENIAYDKIYSDEKDRCIVNYVEYAKTMLDIINSFPEDQITNNLIEHRKAVEKKICEVKK